MISKIDGKEVEMLEGIVALVVCSLTGFATRLINSAYGALNLAVVLIPIVFLCPGWELAPWIRAHAFSVTIVVFLVQFLFPRKSEPGPGAVSFQLWGK